MWVCTTEHLLLWFTIGLTKCDDSVDLSLDAVDTLTGQALHKDLPVVHPERWHDGDCWHNTQCISRVDDNTKTCKVHELIAAAYLRPLHLPDYCTATVHWTCVGDVVTGSNCHKLITRWIYGWSTLCNNLYHGQRCLKWPVCIEGCEGEGPYGLTWVIKLENSVHTSGCLKSSRPEANI